MTLLSLPVDLIRKIESYCPKGNLRKTCPSLYSLFTTYGVFKKPPEPYECKFKKNIQVIVTTVPLSSLLALPNITQIKKLDYQCSDLQDLITILFSGAFQRLASLSISHKIPLRFNSVPYYLPALRELRLLAAEPIRSLPDLSRLTHFTLRHVTPSNIKMMSHYKKLEEISFNTYRYALYQFDFNPISFAKVNIEADGLEQKELNYLFQMNDEKLVKFRNLSIKDLGTHVNLLGYVLCHAFHKEFVMRLVKLKFEFISYNSDEISEPFAEMFLKDQDLFMEYFELFDFENCKDRSKNWHMILYGMGRNIIILNKPILTMCEREVALNKFFYLFEFVFYCGTLNDLQTFIEKHLEHLPRIFKKIDSNFINAANDYSREPKIHYLMAKGLPLLNYFNLFLEKDNYQIFFFMKKEEFTLTRFIKAMTHPKFFKDMIRYFGGVPREADRNGNTIYHFAMFYPVISQLLDKETDPDFIMQKNNKGETPFHFSTPYRKQHWISYQNFLKKSQHQDKKQKLEK